MTNQPWTRREVLQTAALAGTSLMALNPNLARSAATPSTSSRSEHSFRYALNTSTISGSKPTIVEAMTIASQAGYDGIEPWIRELDAHTQAGGSLDDLRKRASDQHLMVVDAIGFFEWAVDDNARRVKGLEEARRNMEMVARIGGTRLAAPPFGATDPKGVKLDLGRVAERYRTLLELGENFNVTPIVEIWGFSQNVQTLAEAVAVAVGADHDNAAILADVYHLGKGDSGVAGLKLLGPNAVPILHINDYPAKPREDLSDADRVYPGDGSAPITAILRALNRPGSTTVLSLELFNRDYWKLDPAIVAATGLSKIRDVVQAALV